MYTNRLLAILLCFISIKGYAQVVTNSTELNNAIAGATPGAIITLADGTWNNVFININKNGTSTSPITITAQTPGSVLMTGNSRVYMEGSYLTVSGLVFQNPSNLIISGSSIEPVFELDQCDHCKVLNNKIDTYNGTESEKTLTFKWVLLDDSEHIEIAYNSFIGKYGIGSIINDNRQQANPDYIKIHHNYFADRTPINGLNDDNDQDAIRIGTSTTSLSSSFSEVYDNYFYNFFGEIEVISNKSGNNKYYNNTFRDYAGCLTLRHGDNCEVYGNYFFAENNAFTAGVRVIGEGHKVYNNYIEGINSFKPNGSSSNVTGGINVSNGETNSPLNGYYQVIDAEIVNNTFVNCDYALRIGTVINGNSEEPVNLTVANNIMYNTSINAYQTVTAPSGSSISLGNIINVPTSDLTDDGNFHRLTSGSAPIDAGIGSYAYLTQDVLDGIRGANFDAGAEEFGAGGTRFPYTAADVGVNIGFGISAGPVLTVAPTSLTFSPYASSLTFTINSNVAWTITENLSWLSLDITSGSGTTTVTATVTQNTTGVPLTGNITIAEVAGGSGLSVVLPVTQPNPFQGTGEVIITEYHNRPLKPTQAQLDIALNNNPFGADTTPNEGHTEWFEVYNTTSLPVVMDGWTLTDASSSSNVSTISSFTLPANSYAVFAGFNIPDAQGGLVFDYFYSYKKPSFNNESSYSDPGDTSCPDGVIIQKADGTLVDEVKYDYGYGEYIGNPNSSTSCSNEIAAIGIPPQNGSSKVSMMLNVDPAIMNAADNDLAANWSYSTIVYDAAGGQIGTPGLANDGSLPPVDAGTGEVIITEIYNRPLKPTQTQLDAALPNNPFGADTSPNEGHTEWFEVYNTTNAPVVMDGWTLTDASSSGSVSTISSFTLGAGQYAVFSGFNIPAAQGGVVFDYFYSYKKPSFNNESSYSDPGDTSCPDGVIIQKADGTLVDEVKYDYGYGEYIGNPNSSSSCSNETASIGFPPQNGSSRVSMMLNVDPAIMNATDNNLAANWSFSTIVYDPLGNQIGTPGLQNDGQTSCEADLILSGLNTTTGVKEAEFTITSTEQIAAGVTVDYSAGTGITLNPGFEVILGAVFHAYILGCTQ